ncbi:MAG: hypothetical protein PHV34_15060 [Verrucomicrobiae bacterium]|nr:hypothetical protein [Verrucomicrobiae bacterium]
MKNTPIIHPIGNISQLECKKNGHLIQFANVSLAGTGILRDPLSFRFRHIDTRPFGVPTAWKDVPWQAGVRKGNELIWQADVRFNDTPQHRYSIRMIARPRQYSIGNRSFTGIGFRFEAARAMAFPMELEIGLPLGRLFSHCHVQDLYTPKKCGVFSDQWQGMRWGHWQGERSPMDLFTGKDSALMVRLDHLLGMFSSGGEWVKNKGPLPRYRYTFDSETRWKSAEWSLLFLREKMSLEQQKDLWSEVFLSESERFRKAAGVKREEVLPMANIPIDGGTPGCAPKPHLKIQGHFDDFAEKTLSLCDKLNFRRIMVGSPWISYRTLGIKVKSQSNITYDSRCGILDFEVAPQYGGKKAFRIFCDKAHEKNIEVYAWYPAFHLANHSHYLTEHPEWIIRKVDGSPFTWVYYHITAISARIEAQRHFLSNLRAIRKDCGLDGLWLDSYVSLPFMSLDYSRKQGVADAPDAIAMVKRFQDIGLKIINEGYSPFGARGDGETMFFLNQEDAAVETSLFTYYKNNKAILKDNAYFRFLANKAPLTVAVKYLPKSKLKAVGEWNRAFSEAVRHMIHRQLLADNRGVVWKDETGVEILFACRDFPYQLKHPAAAVDLVSGETVNCEKGLRAKKWRIYKISPLDSRFRGNDD